VSQKIFPLKPAGPYLPQFDDIVESFAPDVSRLM